MKLTPKPLSEQYRQPTPDWLFDGFLRRKTLSMAASGPFVGKTNLGVHMMLCAEFGIPLFGKFPCQHPMSFLYIESDSPEWDFDMIVRRHAIGLGISDSELEHASCRKLHGTGLRVVDPNFRVWLKQMADSGIGGVIFDTFRRFMDGDENDSAEVSKVMESYEWMRDELGLTTMFLHHVGKPSLGAVRTYRGSEVIQGSTDYHIVLNKKDDIISVSYEKGRGHGMFEALEVSLVDTEDGGLRFVSPTISPQEDILALLRAHGPLTRVKLMGALHSWEGTDYQKYRRLDQHIKALVKKGMIERVEKEWKIVEPGSAGEHQS